jgi:5-aminolevulinate synthase
MHPFRAACRRSLSEISREGRYRVFTPLRKDAARFPVYTMMQDGGQRDITVWSSNDYLGMGVHPW